MLIGFIFITGVSAELGMKLLAPTPGAKLLMKHLTRKERPEEEKAKTYDEIAAQKKARILENQLGARKLLMATKRQTPRLGRGMAAVGFINLDAKINKGQPLDPTKAAAILALRGKSLTKNDPNYVMNRKRSIDEIEKSELKAAEALKKSDEMEDEIGDLEAGGDAPKQKKAKIIRSFTGEIIDEKRMKELRNKKSLNQNLANAAEIEEEEKYFDRNEKKEAMEEKMINTKELESK